MHVGVVFPHTEIGNDPAAIRDYAQAAEALGYSHLLAYDHVLGAIHAGREPKLAGPYTEQTHFHEPFVLFGFIAAATTRLGLATGVIILPQRQTALVAKQAAEVDILSGGRLRLGVGTGWNYVEYESLNEDYATRGARQVEQIEVLRRLWTEPVIDYSGRFHRIDRAGIQPLPGRSIPIWLGGYSDVVLKRAARLGDGFIFGRPSTLAIEGIGRMRQWAVEFGRNPDDLGFETQLTYGAVPEAWAGELARWRAAGGTHTSVNTMGAGLISPYDHIEAIRRYAEVARAFMG